METLHLDKPKLKGSDYFGAMNQMKKEPRAFAYFGAMNQMKQEPRAFAYFGAMHLDNQFLILMGCLLLVELKLFVFPLLFPS